MYLTRLLFFVCLCISLPAVLNAFLQLDGLTRNSPSLVGDDTESDEGLIEKDLPNDEVVEDLDFEDDHYGDLINSFDPEKVNVPSVTHLHEKQGEILVPCFGMWWPVGGGASYYDYGEGDYGGDGKKRKRRRSRKQKKSARMKKRRS